VPVWFEQFDGLIELSLDYERNELVLVDAELGEIRSDAPPGGVPPLLDFRQVTVRVRDRALVMVTPGGRTIEVELFWFDDQRTRQRGRPVVYLDQNKWVQLAQALVRPDRVRDSAEREATLALVALARQGTLILPLSSGHYIETGPLYEDRRRQLASNMVELSSGWIMRDPLTVRMQELVLSFHSQGSPASIRQPVFTLDPAALETRGELPPERSGGSLEDTTDVLANASARFAVLLENSRIKNPEGDAYTAEWAAAQQGWADALAGDRAARGRARSITLGVFLTDLGQHLTSACIAAGVTEEAFRCWLHGTPDEHLKQLPYLGRAREVHYQRLMNPQDRWHPHDLIDWMYLPLAAGYADHVVCENSHAHQLRRAQRAVLTPGAEVHTSFGQLLSALSSPVGERSPER